MKALITGLLVLLAGAASATQVRFDFTPFSGVPVSGYIIWDYSDFDGSDYVEISNGEITDLMLSLNGENFGPADFSPGGGTFFDDSGALPVIDEAIGFLAGSWLIRTGFEDVGRVQFDDTANRVVGVAEAEARFLAPVPLPASGLLLAGGLFGVLAARRRPRSA